MRKLIACVSAALVCAALCLGIVGCSGGTAGSSSGSGSMTVLVYMDGSDLESQGKSGTLDIKEMCAADLGDNVNIVLETGGAKKWHTKALQGKDLHRCTIENGKLKVVDTVDAASMVDPATLTDFIEWGTSTYPADRYALIMWDHGGGTASGYGYDENFDEEDTMDLAEMQEALEDSGAHFAFVGFDACLMGTLEIAAAVAPYADYLIGSEESEISTGWYYTNWLDQLGSNPSAPIADIGTTIVDDFVNGPGSDWYYDAQLSVIDCSKIDDVYQQLSSYLQQSEDYIVANEDGYTELASARANTKSFAEDEYDQIDILDYASKAKDDAGIDYSALEAAVNDAIVYSDTNIEGANGLAMIYPYSWPDYYEGVLDTLEQAGVGSQECYDYFGDFLTLTVTAQNDNGGSSLSLLDLVDEFFGGTSSNSTDYSNASWYDSSLVKGYKKSDFTTFNDDKLKLREDSDGFYVKLSSEEMGNLKDVSTGVFLATDDGGWWDMGINDVYTYDEATGRLAVDFDYNWVTVNDQFVAYYNIDFESDDAAGTWSSYGYSPAFLNGDTAIEVLICYDQDNPDGQVIGYRIASEDEDQERTVFDRSCLQFKDGDTISFSFDYYDSNGDYVESEVFDDDIVYSAGDGLAVGTDELDNSYEVSVAVRLTDIYNNEFWTDEVDING